MKLEFRREVEDLRGIIRSELATLRAQVERVEREQAITHDQLEEVRTDMSVCKRAVANGVGISTPTPRVEVPNPTIFDGRREARVIDDFLWEVTRYLEAMGIKDDTTKIHTTTMYLKDTAALW